MKKEIIKVFNEGKEMDLPLEEIRGGWCLPNITCSPGDGTCNVDICTPDSLKPTCPQDIKEP